MITLEVVSTSPFKRCAFSENEYWFLIRISIDDEPLYYLRRFVEPDEDFTVGTTWEVNALSDTDIRLNKLLRLGSISHLADQHQNDNPQKGMGLNTVMNFGRWDGYEVGIVYLFDPDYLDWCISNIDDFFIDDIDLLEKFGVFPLRKDSVNEVLRITNDQSLAPWVNEWKSIQDYASAVGYADTTFRFSDDLRRLNEEKLKRLGLV